MTGYWTSLSARSKINLLEFDTLEMCFTASYTKFINRETNNGDQHFRSPVAVSQNGMRNIEWEIVSQKEG